MHLKLVILMALFCSKSFGQIPIYVTTDQGHILKSQDDHNSWIDLGNYGVFNDIAQTPNGALFVVSDGIYSIDTTNANTVLVDGQFDYSGTVGLCALNNDVLLFDKGDSLYAYSIMYDQHYPIDEIGVFSNGDLCFSEGQLYLISELNEIIKIDLDTLNLSINTIDNLGVANTNQLNCFGITSSADNCRNRDVELFIFESASIIEYVEGELVVLNPNIGSGEITGATSLNEFRVSSVNISELPNVITPNGDDINDRIEFIGFYITVTNRWGNTVYEGLDNWNGLNSNNEECIEGVYYYTIHNEECPSDRKQSFIHLLR